MIPQESCNGQVLYLYYCIIVYYRFGRIQNTIPYYLYYNTYLPSRVVTGSEEPIPGRSESTSETTHACHRSRTRTMPVHSSQVYKGHGEEHCQRRFWVHGAATNACIRRYPEYLDTRLGIVILRRPTVLRCAENRRRGASSIRTQRQDAPVVSAEAQGGVGHI